MEELYENIQDNYRKQIVSVIYNILEKKNMTVNDLAFKLCKKEKEVLKWLTTPYNFHMRLIINIGFALDTIITITFN